MDSGVGFVLSPEGAAVHSQGREPQGHRGTPTAGSRGAAVAATRRMDKTELPPLQGWRSAFARPHSSRG